MKTGIAKVNKPSKKLFKLMQDEFLKYKMFFKKGREVLKNVKKYENKIL